MKRLRPNKSHAVQRVMPVCSQLFSTYIRANRGEAQATRRSPSESLVLARSRCLTPGRRVRRSRAAVQAARHASLLPMPSSTAPRSCPPMSTKHVRSLPSLLAARCSLPALRTHLGRGMQSWRERGRVDGVWTATGLLEVVIGDLKGVKSGHCACARAAKEACEAASGARTAAAACQPLPEALQLLPEHFKFPARFFLGAHVPREPRRATTSHAQSHHALARERKMRILRGR
jgi:hypothetical protein